MNKIKQIVRDGLLLLSVALVPSWALAADAKEELSKLGANVDAVTRQANVLIQQSEHPQSSSINVFLAVHEDADFQPTTLTVSVDGNKIAQMTYKKSDMKAFLLGGFQSVAIKSVGAGAHKLEATIAGVNPKNKPLQFSTSVNFSGAGKNFVLSVQEPDGDIPAFSIKEWSAK